MKSILPFICIISALIYISSCNGKSRSFGTEDSLANAHILAGKLCFFAPEFDSTTLEVTVACDCCSGHIMFLDDSNFLQIDYCEAGTSFTRGKYVLDDKNLTLNFDSITVDKYFPEPDEADSSVLKTGGALYTTTIGQAYQRVYKKQIYKNILIFTSKSAFAALEKNENTDSLMKSVRNEGIWDRLNTDPKLIPRNPILMLKTGPKGIWALQGEPNASFEIGIDSIYYVDQFKSFPYKIYKDSMKITYDSYELAFRFKMIGNDTLVFEGHERQLYHRFSD
jgi:hypothetical protein